jgi:hypothetical protein
MVRGMTTTMNLRRLVAVLVLGGTLAACGGGGGDEGDGVASIDEGAAAEDDDGGGDSGGGAVDEAEIEDAMLEFAECMRENGVDMPDPKFEDGGGVSLGFDADSGIDPESEEFKAAEEACEPIMEEARPDVQLSPDEQAEMQDRLVAMAECMRARGHDMPDPQVGEDGGVTIRREAGAPGEVGGPPDEQFDQDMEECSDEAGMGDGPMRGPRGNSSSEDDE